MKQNFTYYCIACLCAALFLSACADDWDVRRGHVIQEGVPVTVSLDFGVSASKVVTRAAESVETEQTVNRVYVFAFNSDGSLDNKMLYSPSSSTSDCIELLDFPMHSGYDKRFYAVANPTSGSGTLGTETLARIETEEELLACTSSLLVPTNIERSYFLMSGKMEASEEGRQIDVTETGQIRGAKLCDHNVPGIELQRVDARITFKIKGKEGLNFVPDRYWVENIPQHTYVFPHDEDYVSDTPADDYASMSDKQYNVQRNVEGQDEEEYYMFEFYLAENRLQPAQRIETGDAATEGTKTLYALREKRLKTPLTGETGKEGQTEVNGAFKYANPHSAYVVFHGILSYTDGDRYVYADATYTVHLGNTGSAADANNPELVNNYDTERNTHYIYTVTITGVESMRVEVEEDKEQRPGVEGDLIFSGDAVKEMDAHYGRTQFKLKRENIQNGLSWAIRTPFQNGMNSFPDKHFVEKEDGTVSTNREDYTDDQWQSLQTGLDLNDYKWVQFVIDDEAGVADGSLAKYPGYQCYCDPTDANVQAPPFGSEGAVPLSTTNYPDRNKVVLYDVNQLVNHLYAEAKNADSDIFDAEGDVTITAFVDEYVYVYDPREVYYRSPLSVHDNDPEVDLTLWKEAVNRDNRMLYLCSTGSIYSPDGETSVSRNVFTITQKPIYTFYNANDPEIDNGWGTESINETGPIRPTLDPDNSDDNFSNPAAYPNSVSNGLFNTLGVLYNGETPRNLQWDDIMYLDASDRGDEGGTLNLQEPYNSIWYACIARNRDLNGNNIVDKDEVRWYLASIDQLTDIWIGQNSLNESAWLYHGDGRIRSHVASSSYYTPENPGPGNPYVIWAEEGASRGALSGSTSFNGSRTGTGGQMDADMYGNRNKYHYRCVRNLGISLDKPETPFDRYVAVTEGAYTNREGEQFDELVLSLEGMETNSIRTAIVEDAEQPAHNERDYVNRPYRKFAVIKDHDYTLPNGNQGSWLDYQDVKACPEGYRMPNQRELMLMYTSINGEEHGMSWYDPNTDYSYVCNTAFGYNNLYGGNRPGFMYEVRTGLLFLEQDNRPTDNRPGYSPRHPRGYVRCVRDVPD